MIKAILYDLDGVLCDATEWHYLSFNKALRSVCGFELSREEHNSHFNGLPTKKKLNILIAESRILPDASPLIWKLKQEYTEDFITQLAKVDEEKIQMHSYCKEMGIKLACITNSILSTAELMLKKTGQFEYLDLIIANDLIKNPKPHGEGYIRGMIKFNTMPEETLIVEDSEVGLAAAKSTGANIWKVSGSEEVVLSNLRERL